MLDRLVVTAVLGLFDLVAFWQSVVVLIVEQRVVAIAPWELLQKKERRIHGINCQESAELSRTEGLLTLALFLMYSNGAKAGRGG